MNVKKLSEIVDLQKGKKPELSSSSDGNLPYLTAKYIRREADPEYGIPNSEGSVVVRHDDYVIIMDGSNSGEVFTGLNGILASTMGKLVLKEKINMSYLGYFLDSNKELFGKTKTGSAIPHLSKDIFFNLNIPVPSLQEQEEIVEKLDKVYISKEKLSEKYSQASRLYADLKNSVLKQTFENLLAGNKFSLLGEITTVASGGTPKKSNVEYWNGEINWLSSGELENLYLDSSIKQISKLGLENSSAKIFPEGSLLVGMYDTAAFKMSIINSPMAFNQAICGIMPNNKIDILFIYYQLQFLKNKILKQRVGVRQQNLNLSKMRNIEVVIPDLKVQKVISKNIYKQFSYIEELSNINSNKNPKLQELVKSALRKEFSYE